MSARGQGRRMTGANLAVAVVGASLALTTSVAPSSPASAVDVTIGPIEAQMANHHGTVEDTVAVGGGNCIRYNPRGSATATSSTFVTNTGTQTNEARTAHGREGNNCPGTLDTGTQSAIGFRPSPNSIVQDGQQFLIGRMIHYNNPIQAADRYFVGTMNVRLDGIAGDPTLAFPWTLEETPNDSSSPNDELAFSSQISPITVSQGGFTFRLVIFGFVPTGTTGTCPATPAAGVTPVNRFSTVESTQTHACLYASLQQDRSPLTVIKQVAGTAPARTFGFTSSSSLAGSAWANGSFSLSAAGTRAASLTSGETVTVTETDPGDDRWSLIGLTCTQVGANGLPQPVPGTSVDVAARQAVLGNIPAPPNPSQPGITCTYTNTYTPKATLTLVKQVASGTAAPSLWTLTATGPQEISGRSGAAAVTAQRVRAGTYVLTETGTGAAETGYVQQGNWICTRGDGTTVPVTAGGSVTLADSAATDAAARVTCTVTNRQAAGSLQINKVVDAPAGAYTGGTAKTFAGTYDCGTGSSGSFATLTTASPVVISGIPAGRTCTVTETPPTGGLANASYAWGPATYSEQPVTIGDLTTSAVTITNPVVQRFGTFALSKSIDGPGGYIGAIDRSFPVDYTCTLTGGPTTSDTVEVTVGAAVSPAAPIPVGSVCTFTEALTTLPGDFLDASYTWSGSTFTPSTVTIGVDTTSAVTVTNTYVREFGSLIIAKDVVGDGYIGGGGPNFRVGYSCGTGFEGFVTVADGGSTTISGLPARVPCTVQEDPPAAGLLSPAFRWGTPTWSPGAVATVPAGGSTTLTVSNPTEPIFGQLRVTKAIDGATQGVAAGTTFELTASCTNGEDYPFTLGVDETGSSPDIPVGTSCTVSEADPDAAGLIDSSFAWGPTPADQTVTITRSGEAVAVTMTNTVVRVTGTLSITKAPITPAGVVDPDRTFSIGFSCVYGGDSPVTGTVTLTAGETASTPPVFLGSRCTVTEDAAGLQDPPDPADPSWVWLPVTYVPAEFVVVDSATTPVSISVVNSVRQLSGSFSVSKRVVGEGKAGGYDGGAFDFDVTCVPGTSTDFSLVDGANFDAGAQVAFADCTLTEVGVPPPTSPAFGWDPVSFTINGVPAGSGSSVTFEVPAAGAPLQINVTNPITPRFGSVTVTKTVTGETAGLVPGTSFTVNLACGAGLLYTLAVPANGSATQGDIPAGSECTATESTPPGGLVDASFAWGIPTYVPETVTVPLGASVTVAITNPIVRVTAPVQLVKSYIGPQEVIDPARTYPVTWTCTYDGTVVASGTEDVVADPNGVVVDDAVPVTSECTAIEGDLGPPSVDPAFRWEAPVITGTTVALPGPNTITVVNRLSRDNGRVIVRKVVTGATEGYIGGTGENFALHGQCRVEGEPQIPIRTRSGTIANGGVVVIEPVSIGWTCSGVEDRPSQDLLLDSSYAWGQPVLDPPGDFMLTRADPEQEFLAENPIVRVTGSFSIVKVVDDPFGAVDPAATFSGQYSCQYGAEDPPVVGDWEIGPGDNGTFVVPESLFLESVCTVTEDAPAPSALRDASFAWAAPVVGAPVTIVAGDTAAVTVTNTVTRLYGGLQIDKTVVDPDGGLLPTATFMGVWECTQGTDTYSGRFTVGAGAATIAFTPAEARVPATAVCTITEDTLLDTQGLRDRSFAWGRPTYAPPNVTLAAGATATLGVRNSVIRVYSDVTISKVVIGPAADLVPDDREFTGTITCRYGTDDPIETTWSATTATPALRSGVLVESVCTVTEDQPGFGGGPVAGDTSYVWLPPLVGGPATVGLPTGPPTSVQVTNPTDRLFGTFDVTKRVDGRLEGMVDPRAPFVMEFACVTESGESITGTLEVPATITRGAGPDLEIPTGSTCTLTEPLATMPPLVDASWTWGDPAFLVEGEPGEADGRQLTFLLPTPQEDDQEPNVPIVVTNPLVHDEPELTIAKSVASAPVRNADGTQTLAYEVVVNNVGLGPRTYDLTDTFAFAAGVTVADVSVTNTEPGSISTNAGFDGATDTAVSTASIAAGATHRYRIEVTADVSAVATATAADCTLDPGESGTGLLNRATANPTAEACTPITGVADVRVAKRVDRTRVTVGSTGRTRLTYTIEVTNAGPAAATDVIVTDTLPGGVVPVGAEPSTGSCTRAGAVLTCPLGTLAVGATAEIAVTIDLLPTQPAGNVRNTVAVSSSSFDPDDTNNAAEAVTEVAAAAGQLPVTGTQIAGLLAVATGMFCGGWLLLLARRRRQS